MKRFLVYCTASAACWDDNFDSFQLSLHFLRHFSWFFDNFYHKGFSYRLYSSLTWKVVFDCCMLFKFLNVGNYWKKNAKDLYDTLLLWKSSVWQQQQQQQQHNNNNNNDNNNNNPSDVARESLLCLPFLKGGILDFWSFHWIMQVMWGLFIDHEST